jgi:hypothetical protein
MRIHDTELQADIDVYDRDCPARPCYWPREDPGVFVDGRGYHGGSDRWLCGTRQIHGCPDDASGGESET